MTPDVQGVLIAGGILVATAICLEAGYRLGRWRLTDDDRSNSGNGSIEAAVIGLLGLLLGFSFAGGTSRLDHRRQLIIQEANAVGTAYLRVDLLEGRDQPEMRQLFRDYLDERLNVYRAIPDMPAALRVSDRCEALKEKIWARAVTATLQERREDLSRLLLPALNEMFDVATARTVMLFAHTPLLILVLLLSVAMLSGLLAGYGMASRRSRSPLHLMIYPLVVSITFYAVIDLDFPRGGLIRLDAADRALRQVRESMR
jgi:hypothetical protein